MHSDKHIVCERYRTERSAELSIACDITTHSITVIYYDLVLERRYARSVAFGYEITPQSANDELEKMIVTSMRECSVKSSAIKKIGIAAPVHIESALERTFRPESATLSDKCEVLYVPFISAGISGRFTASLLTLPVEQNWVAVDFGKTLCLAHKSSKGLNCAAFPLLGAFDGSALENGMPAGNGAIDVVRWENDRTIAYEVVGDCDSIGISPCGAATATEIMQKNGILDSDGIMIDRDLFYIGEDFFISQNDIRAIQTDKARTAAAFELLPDIEGQTFFSGEPFSTAEGFRALLGIGAVPERFKSAAFCRNSTEQGIISFLENEKTRELAYELSKNAKDFSRDNLLKYDKEYLNYLNF